MSQSAILLGRPACKADGSDDSEVESVMDDDGELAGSFYTTSTEDLSHFSEREREVLEYFRTCGTSVLVNESIDTCMASICYFPSFVCSSKVESELFGRRSSISAAVSNPFGEIETVSMIPDAPSRSYSSSLNVHHLLSEPYTRLLEVVENRDFDAASMLLREAVVSKRFLAASLLINAGVSFSIHCPLIILQEHFFVTGVMVCVQKLLFKLEPAYFIEIFLRTFEACTSDMARKRMLDSLRAVLLNRSIDISILQAAFDRLLSASKCPAEVFVAFAVCKEFVSIPQKDLVSKYFEFTDPEAQKLFLDILYRNAIGPLFMRELVLKRSISTRKSVHLRTVMFHPRIMSHFGASELLDYSMLVVKSNSPEMVKAFFSPFVLEIISSNQSNIRPILRLAAHYRLDAFKLVCQLRYGALNSPLFRRDDISAILLDLFLLDRADIFKYLMDVRLIHVKSTRFQAFHKTLNLSEAVKVFKAQRIGSYLSASLTNVEIEKDLPTMYPRFLTTPSADFFDPELLSLENASSIYPYFDEGCKSKLVIDWLLDLSSIPAIKIFLELFCSWPDIESVVLYAIQAERFDFLQRLLDHELIGLYDKFNGRNLIASMFHCRKPKEALEFIKRYSFDLTYSDSPEMNPKGDIILSAFYSPEVVDTLCRLGANPNPIILNSSGSLVPLYIWSLRNQATHMELYKVISECVAKI